MAYASYTRKATTVAMYDIDVAWAAVAAADRINGGKYINQNSFDNKDGLQFNKAVAALYDMIHPAADPKVTVRSVFIIDPNKKVRLTLTYPPSAGRNVDEILRVLVSLQLTEGKKLATPVDWKPGDDVIISPAAKRTRTAACSPPTHSTNGW